MSGGKKIRKKNRYDKEAYLMILPAYTIFTVFILIPVFMVLYYSFTNYNLYSAPDFVGLKNYMKAFRDRNFIVSVKNTMFYAVITLTLQLSLGLFLAVLLYRKSRLIPVFRTAIYLPHVMSMVCVSMVWLWIFDANFGLLNIILKALGLPIQKWLLDPKLAMPCVIAVSIWKGMGYSMVIFLSGLTGIPESLYEAAELDGAGAIKKFTKITWPLLQPTTFFLVVTGIVNCFAVFEQVNILTNGGPLKRTTTVVHQIYQSAFLEFKMGYASSLSVLLLAFSLCITLFLFRFGNKGQDIDVS